jgi:hypothetical protein
MQVLLLKYISFLHKAIGEFGAAIEADSCCGEDNNKD